MPGREPARSAPDNLRTGPIDGGGRPFELTGAPRRGGFGAVTGKARPDMLSS
jgi:hypothetical protein